MDSKEFFENYFKKKKKHSYSKSLLTFFLEIVQPRLPPGQMTILDLGAGNYSLFEDVNFPDKEMTKVRAIDFSTVAIESSPKSFIEYCESSVCDPTYFKESHYDLIFDSHCLNCITTEVDRNEAFNHIYSALKPKGLLAAEMMVQPIGRNVSMPYKWIKNSLEIEQEIVSHGFTILYFMISRDSGFVSEVEGVEVTCDLIKIVAQK